MCGALWSTARSLNFECNMKLSMGSRYRGNNFCFKSSNMKGVIILFLVGNTDRGRGYNKDRA